MLDLETYTGGIVSTNAHLLRLPGGTLLVDAPQDVALWLREKEVKVDALFLTHQHFDHVMDAGRIQADHGCPVYAWTAFDRHLTLEKFFGAMAGSSFSVPEFTVDHVLQEEATVQACGCDWKLFHVPGHSADSLCFWQPELELLFSGDVILCGGFGRSDFPGGSFEQLLSGIRQKLLPLPAETAIYSGHGPATTLGDEKETSPYL